MSDEHLDVLLTEIPASREEALALVNNPRWERAGKVHDWRNHVPWFIRNVWDQLSEETRIVVYVIAEEGAGNEEWD